MESKQQRKARVSETRGGSVLVLAGGSFLLASEFTDGAGRSLWLGVVIFLMCVAVALLAAAEVVKELVVDGDE